MAVRFKQLTPDQWPLERLRQKDVDTIYPKYNGQVSQLVSDGDSRQSYRWFTVEVTEDVLAT